MRLVGEGPEVPWQGRGHFFAAAAQAMRRILVDSARRKKRVKHGGGRQRVDLNEHDVPVRPPAEEIVALDDALQELATLDPRKAQVIELRFFGGLSVREAAEVLKISEDSVLRDWRLARSWLLKELSAPSPSKK